MLSHWPMLLSATVAVLFTAAQIPRTQTAVDLTQLQGHWEGTGAGGKCSITIDGNSLLYRVGTNWHKTTFTLPAGKDPQQLHATIVDTWPESKDAIGQVIPALIKVEDGTLTLAAFSMSADAPKSFEEVDASNKYFVRKVQPKKEDARTPGSK